MYICITYAYSVPYVSTREKLCTLCEVPFQVIMYAHSGHLLPSNKDDKCELSTGACTQDRVVIYRGVTAMKYSYHTEIH